jgi:hypothetical protein
MDSEYTQPFSILHGLIPEHPKCQHHHCPLRETFKSSPLHPPHTCHPPGILGGMVFGMVNRIYTLVSDEESIKTSIFASFRHLQRRGCQHRDLHPLFQSAIKRSKENALHPPPASDPSDLQKFQFFHIEYHPMNLPARTIQYAWRKTITNPPNKLPLSEIIGHHGVECGIDRLIVAYHRPPTLATYFLIGS